VKRWAVVGGGGVASAVNGWQAGEKVEQPAGEVLGVEVMSNGDGRGSGRSEARGRRREEEETTTGGVTRSPYRTIMCFLLKNRGCRVLLEN
jgi:hypothetical protein